MTKVKLIKILLAFMLLIACRIQAADKPLSDSLNVYRELLRLRAELDDTTHLSFDALFCMENVDSATVRDTMRMTYRITKHQYRIAVNDSLEVVQNRFYNLILYHDRNLAIISKPVELVKYLFHANLLDTTFNSLFIAGTTVSAAGSFRRISYQFKAGSPYEKYDIFYNPTTYRIDKIEYQMRKHPFSTTPGMADDRIYVNIRFSNYQTGLFNDSLFSTDPYILRKQGIFHMTSPYVAYELINSLNQ